ncbi:MAG: tetratricopeptide repeat protein, partial [Brevinema sp.]
MKQIRISFFFLALPVLVFAQYSQQILRESLSTQELDTGIALFNERRYAAAIQAFEQALAHEPRNHAARYRLGMAYLYAGYPQNAASSWEALNAVGAADYQVISKLNEIYSTLSETELESVPLDYTFTGYYDGFSQAAHRLQRSAFVTYDTLGDRKFISSFGTGGVLELDGMNSILREYGRRFLRPAILKNPTGVVATSNSLYVADFQQDKIFVFNRDLTGSLKTSFGQKGPDYGQLSGVMGLSIGREGHLYVVNGGNARIDRFTTEGIYVSTFGEGYLFRPTDIEITDTRIYVTDISVDGQGRLMI